MELASKIHIPLKHSYYARFCNEVSSIWLLSSQLPPSENDLVDMGFSKFISGSGDFWCNEVTYIGRFWNHYRNTFCLRHNPINTPMTMEINPIEEKAYATMKQRFESFAREIEELCCELSRDKTWLDNQDVCLLLDIKPRTLQHYRDMVRLPYSMIGNKCYYKPSDVQKLIDDSHIK